MPITKTFTDKYAFSDGQVWFDLFDSAGLSTGERFLGECKALGVTIENQKVQYFSRQTPIEQLAVEVTRRVDRKGALTIMNISQDNLALFVAGTAATLAQTSATVTDEIIAVGSKTDRWYQLGVSASFPAGARSVSSVVVKNNAGSTTYVVDVDYQVDEVRGRLLVLSTGSIAANANLKVTYARAAKSIDQVKADATKQLKGALRFLANNASGDNNDLWVPSCNLSPNGTFTILGGEEIAEMGFDFACLKKDSSTEALYIDGQPY